MFSGAGVKNDPLRDLPGLVEMDIKKGWDLNDDKIYGVVLWMAREGRVKHIIGGPPAGTFSPWHYKKDQEGRQRPLRSTHEPWGLREGLNPDESSKVLNENVMLCKMVWLWLCAEAAHGGQEGDEGKHHVGFCIEYPEDPHSYMPEGEHRDACVSLRRTEFMKEFVKETNLVKYQFEQGTLGHMFRRPTCCLSNLSLGIHGRKNQRAYVAADTKDVDQSVWPHGFRITLADAIHEWRSGESPVVLRKVMTKKELEEWKAHVERGHWPYRRDCSVCLAASGTGRPARRVIHRDAYVMSLDIPVRLRRKGRTKSAGKSIGLCWRPPTSTQRSEKFPRISPSRMRRRRKSFSGKKRKTKCNRLKSGRIRRLKTRRRNGRRRLRTLASRSSCKCCGFVLLWSGARARRSSSVFRTCMCSSEQRVYR